MKKLDIIYEDKEIIVINKPSKIPTIAPTLNDYRNLYHEVRTYLKKINPHNKVFIVHRLDRDTSGVILFAKNEKIKKVFQERWNEICKIREYYALVEGKLAKKKDCLKYYLKSSKTLEVYVTKDKKNGKLAITNYEVIKETNQNSLLRITIETGRRNQIRASLSHLGHPIVGDKKYHAKTNPFYRVALHATKLIIIHPITKKEMVFSSPIPWKI